MKEGYIDVTDGVLFYEACGDGEPIVLIHGNYNDHLIWEEQMSSFSKRHNMISYDLRGYGQSDTPERPYSNVEDLKVLMDTLGLAKATIVGSSMGGSIAIDFALAYPERVQRLILAAPALSGRSYPASLLWQGIKQHVQVRMQGRQRAIEAFIHHSFWRYFFPDPSKEKAWQTTVANVRNPANFCRFPPNLAHVTKPYAIHRLAELQCPTLILIGELDHPFNRETANILHVQIKDAILIRMEGCGHLPFVEEPDQFNTYVAEFVAAQHPSQA